MPSLYPLQNNFTAGELTPRLALRTDFSKYLNGCETLENFVPLPHGGLRRRPGTRYVTTVKDSTRATRLIPFEFSTTQAYILEVGHLYMRFYKDSGIITETAKTITGLTQANPAVVTATAHGFSNGDRVLLGGVGGMVQVNNREFTVANVTANTFELSGLNSTAYTAYTSGGSAAKIVEIATPYDETDLFELKYAQSADTLYLVHPAYAPQKLTRTSHTAWTLTAVEFVDGPYMDTNTTATTLTPSGAGPGAGITLTASSTTGINDDTGFQPTDVGRLIRMQENSTWGWAVITGYTSTTVVTITVEASLTNSSAKSVWRLGAWSETTGYPGAIGFFEQRLGFAGSTAQPQTVWLSESDSYEDMTPGTDDSAALTYTIAANQVNVIRWLSSARALLIGTVGGEFAMFGSSDAPLTPTNVTVRRQSAHGSGTQAPLTVGSSTLFVQRAGRKIRQLDFKFESDSYIAIDTTLLSEHVTEGGIVEMSFQQEPDSVIWFVRGDGVLVSLTYLPLQEVVGFARHTTDGFFESVATIPHPNLTTDQTWTIVRRVIDGQTVRYVEYLDDTLYVDSGLGYDGAATTTVTGAWHLNAESVAIHGDGAVYPSATVSTGSVVLNGIAAEDIQLGLAFTPYLKTVRPFMRTPEGGSSVGRPIRWAEVLVHVYQTVGLQVEDDLIDFRASSDEMDAGVAAFTGAKRVSNTGWDRLGQITIQQTQPLPVTILALTGQIEVGQFD